MRVSGLRKTAVLGRVILASAILSLALAACGSSGSSDSYRTSPDYRAQSPGDAEQRETIFSQGGIGNINLFGSDKEGRDGAVAVNAFLWRASLDTLSFLPLASVDPFGGVIITEWYAPPETPEERFKVNVYILGRTLRADGLKVSVFRQTNDGTGRWNDAPVGADVSREFEDAVLTRARQLRLQAVAENG
ncbi:MAG: DUF3576 domain-containing protein [Rhodospirillaceae bacterium]|nr:DUF3576 domain-containing protein [Rhodospirillaceae bacterium]